MHSLITGQATHARLRRTVCGAVCALTAMFAFPAASLAVGPDGANHTTISSAFGPIVAGTTYSATNAYSDDQDVYAIRNYVRNGNLVLNVQDQYQGESSDCTFWTSCDLQVNVYDSSGDDITPTEFCVEPGASGNLDPVTLPTPGLYYIEVWTNGNNITCGLGGESIPYSLTVQPSTGIGQAPPPPIASPHPVNKTTGVTRRAQAHRHKRHHHPVRGRGRRGRRG